LIASLAGTAEAQPSIRFPDHTTIVVDGVRYEGFDLEGFRQLLLIDADLLYATRFIVLLQEEIATLVEEGDLLREVIAESQLQIETLQAERDRLRAKWEEENRLRLDCENSPDFLSWAGWGLAGAFSVATLVLGLVVGFAL